MDLQKHVLPSPNWMAKHHKHWTKEENEKAKLFNAMNLDASQARVPGNFRPHQSTYFPLHAKVVKVENNLSFSPKPPSKLSMQEGSTPGPDKPMKLKFVGIVIGDDGDPGPPPGP